MQSECSRAIDFLETVHKDSLNSKLKFQTHRSIVSSLG